MRILLTIYLAVTAAVYIYVGAACMGKRHAPGAGTVGLLLGLLGGGLAWAVMLGVV